MNCHRLKEIKEAQQDATWDPRLILDQEKDISGKTAKSECLEIS